MNQADKDVLAQVQSITDGIQSTINREMVQFLRDQVEFHREVTRRELAIQERELDLREKQAESKNSLFNNVAPAYLDFIKQMLNPTPPTRRGPTPLFEFPKDFANQFAGGFTMGADQPTGDGEPTPDHEGV